MSLASEALAIQRFSTEHLPADERYEAWVKRDWPRLAPLYRTEPTEPFNTEMENTALGPVMLARVRITGMVWRRGPKEIRDANFDPILVNMMVEGEARGDMDGRPFHEPSGSYHFHDMARPSSHVATASFVYGLALTRDLAEEWLGSLDDLHGLVVSGPMSQALITLAESAWNLLPEMDIGARERFARAMLELLAAGADAARVTAPARVSQEESLRLRAIQVIDQPMGLARLTTEEVARILGVSSERLSAAFRDGGGLKTYLLERRLENARLALADTARAEPIGNIAHRLGFSDAAHLSRAFRQHFGVSPRAYRQKAGQDD